MAVPIPIQAVAPDGRLVVVVVQLAAVPLTPKLVAPCVPLPGKVTWTWASVDAVVGLAQTIPPVVCDWASRSIRTSVLVKVPAEALGDKKGTKACRASANPKLAAAIFVFENRKFLYFI